MKKIFFKTAFVFVSVLFSINSFSQVLKPVKWSFSKEKLSETEYNLVFKASIENKWHLYSQDIEPGGPLPTYFEFDTLDGYEFIGNVIEFPDPKEEMDPNFNMVVRYFSKEATFKQKIKLTTENPIEIKGFLEFMCCDDERCLPPEDIDFSFGFNGNKEALSKIELTDDKNADLISSNINKEKKYITGFLLYYHFWSGLAGYFNALCFSNDSYDSYLFYERQGK